MISITKFKIVTLLLFPFTVILNFISSKNPYFIEKYYSQGINIYIVKALSYISNLFSFSLYELCMYLIVISLTLIILYTIFLLIKRKAYFATYIKKLFLNLASVLSIAYFLFIILWGLNYNKVPLETLMINRYNINHKANIQSTDKSVDRLKELYKFLIESANKARNKTKIDSNNIMKNNTDYKGVIKRASIGYDNISNFDLDMSKNYPNAKYVLSSNLMSYTGIMGIYFPFTGEANINISIPDIYLPSTVAHEMAHQRGFASEDEANFIAYLVCINHPDIDFNYSGYILALNHTASALRDADYNSYVKLSKEISDSVRNDLKNYSNYWTKYEGKVEEISDKFNNSYLKSNGVSDGTLSYSKMVNLLLSYYDLYKF